MGMKPRPKKLEAPKPEYSFFHYYTCESCKKQVRFLERDGLCRSCSE